MKKSSLCILFLALSLCPAVMAQSKSNARSENHTRYLLERIKAITDSGIVGIPAGTEVEVLAQSAEGMNVKTKDGTTFKISAEKLTADPAVAQASKQKADQAEADAKAQRDALLASQRAKNLERQKKAQAALQSMADMSAASAAVPAASATPFVPGKTALDQPAQHTNWVVKRPVVDKDKSTDKAR